MSSLRENLEQVRQRIAAAERRAGRDPGSVKLVAVTKRVAPEMIREAVSAGVRAVGENYVQEAQAKKEALSDLELEWHLIGHLQTNKAKLARSIFSVIETVDRPEVAAALLRAPGSGRVDVLVQVLLGAGEKRAGVAAEELPALLEQLSGLEGLALRGLMGVPPLSTAAGEPRRSFARLRQLFEESRTRLGSPSTWDILSMGMSGDYEAAIEEGATLVRVGTAIFGARTG